MRLANVTDRAAVIVATGSPNVELASARDAAVTEPEGNAAETVAGDALLPVFGHRPPPGLARPSARGEPVARRMAEAAWPSAAACRSTDPDLFFPVSSAGTAQRGIAEARAVCARCLVQAPCREFALRTRQQYGIWGGMTEEERGQVWKRGER